jgi:hypothetical protein
MPMKKIGRGVIVLTGAATALTLAPFIHHCGRRIQKAVTVRVTVAVLDVTPPVLAR